MSLLVLSAAMATMILRQSASQVISVVEVPRPSSSGPQRVSNVSQLTSYRDPSDRDTPVFEFLRPTGVRISIPGPYPPSYRYRLTFHININKEFEGWKQGDWNEGVIVRNGVRWSYTFPAMRVESGDTIYYWIVAQGSDWEKGYKGKYQVTQSSPHGPSTSSDQLTTVGICRKVSETSYSGSRAACAQEALIRSYMTVDPKYQRTGAQYFMESVKQIGGLDPEDTFTVFTKENIIWNSTHNAFVPSLLVDKYGPFAVDSTNFTLKGCNSEHQELCSAGAMGYLILPPVLSGRHSTRQSFSFRYGVLEVTAKLPTGDWLVPELWLLPKDEVYGNRSGRIVLAMSRGNSELSDGTRDYSSRVLEAGVRTGSGEEMFRKVQDKPWNSDYHRFKLIWTPERITFLIDDEEIGRIQPTEEGLDPSLQGSKMAPFDKEFYLVFGVHAGGSKDFPDSVKGKPWKNYEPKNKLKFWRARLDWQQTWTVSSALIIKSLTVTAL